MKYFPRVRRPSHHQVWGIFADIDTIAKHVDVPTVEIITSFLANPDKAVKLNAAASPAPSQSTPDIGSAACGSATFPS